jgi:hypothetical protein
MTDLSHQLGVSGRGANRDIAKFDFQKGLQCVLVKPIAGE